MVLGIPGTLIFKFERAESFSPNFRLLQQGGAAASG
jgi:hypothetical protein